MNSEQNDPNKKRRSRIRWTTGTAKAAIADWAPDLDVDQDWEFEGTKAEVNGQCRIHGESVSPRFDDLQQGGGIGCGGCSGRTKWTTAEALAEIADWAPNLAVDPDWTFEGTKAEVNGQCRVHGESVSPRFTSLQQGGGIGCGGCRLGRTSDESLTETARGRLAK